MSDGRSDTRITGLLTTWNDPRGFGFITTDVGGTRVFVHISGFARASARPVLGARLSFIPSIGSDGRTHASVVTAQRKPAFNATFGRVRPTRSAGRWSSARRRPASFDYLALIGFVLLYLATSIVWPMPLWVLGAYLVLSLIAFLVYALDKRAATAGQWRVAESTLLALGFIGGWPGALIGQQVLRHKTRKVKFRGAFWVTVVLNVVVFVAASVVLSTGVRVAG